MVANPFFNHYSATNEQSLYEGLVVESIKQFAQNMFYLPRRRTNYDVVLGKDDLSLFDTAYFMEFYIESIDGFVGDGNFMSKFGLEIRDQVTFVCSARSFGETVSNHETTYPRPKEGDLIFFPLNQKCFEIKYTNNKEYFYPFGVLTTFRVTCELYEYSNEKFSTGVTMIDSLEELYSTNILDYAYTDNNGVAYTDNNGNVLVVNSYANDTNPDEQNIDIQDEANQYLDWTELDPFSETGQY
ncbi:MAG: hypothetical protein P4L79_11120 [Legionella sp.]|uniref:hypothetical protein n=1 Tax=Legionella sp. TaxID=459 RepID=UPI00284D5043|nr:hypothetical protein [Legionella sp.]